MDRILLSEPTLRRFYAKVVVDLDTGCWNWTAWTNKHGYGMFNVPELGPREAYRVAYEHFVGPVPTGQVLGHAHQGDKCAFWEHVRPITQGENLRESDRVGKHSRSRKAYCDYGHPFTKENVYVNPVTGGRSCKVCRRIAVCQYHGRSCCLTCGYVRCRCV